MKILKKRVKLDNEQLACVNGTSGFGYGYIRQILAGAPKRTNFFKRTTGHHNEEPVISSKKRVSFSILKVVFDTILIL